MNIADHVIRYGASDPQRVALIFEGRSFTYGELHQLSASIASMLSEAGIVPGDRVGIYLPNTPGFILSYLAIQRLGAIAVSLNAFWKQDEVRFALTDSGSRALITNTELESLVPVKEIPSLEHVFLETEILQTSARSADSVFIADPTTPAAIVYSSGTTGDPKGCTLSHGNIISNIQAKVDYLNIRPDDRLLLFVPLFHCFGQNAVMNAAFQAGASIVLQRRFTIEDVLAAVERDAPTMFFGPPTIYSILIDKVHRDQLKSIRYYFSAAAPLSPSIAFRWQDAFGLVLHEGYGLTETSPFATYNHRTAHRAGSVGTAIDGVSVNIVDPESGDSLPVGETGEVIISGPNVMLGYWGLPEGTAQVIRNGWFHTGDIGRLDDEGYLFLTDRLKDMVIVGGLKVYPAEVESVLRRHPSVADAAVFGIDDRLMGEQVCVDIILRPGADALAEELIQFCQRRIAAYKVPSKIRLVKSFPISPTGKILKKKLRDQFLRA